MAACDFGSPLQLTAGAGGEAGASANGGGATGGNANGGAGGELVPEDVPVVLKSLSFLPKEIHVPIGTTVIWDMQDSGTFHFIVEGKPNQSDSPQFESPRLDPGETWQYTFKVPGTYTYFCSNHSTTMRNAKVIVE